MNVDLVFCRCSGCGLNGLARMLEHGSLGRKYDMVLEIEELELSGSNGAKALRLVTISTGMGGRYPDSIMESAQF